MRPFLRSLPALVGANVVFAAMLAIGFVPLFDGPGYESALAAGLILPFAVAIVTALEVSVTSGESPWAIGERTEVTALPEPFDAFCRGVANGGAFGAIAYLTTLVHGVRAGFCDFLGGSAHFALGPLAGALLAGTWGAIAGEIARSRTRRWSRRTVAVSIAIAGPILSIALSVSRFYASPMVFAYDPFVGYFSGTLYDTIVDFSGLLSYRAASAASLFAAFVAALHLAHDERGRLAYHSIGRPGMLVLGGLALAGSVACIVEGNRLGHWQTPDTITAELGALVGGRRCDVVYPRTIPLADAQRFARECDAYVEAGEKWLGVEGPPKIKAFLFADAAQKGALMGASDTFIAKPWRREVYLQAQGFPHPALGHEIIHVLAGTFGQGPFKVAGRWGGLLGNPGLIEGIAVAASPHDGDLTPREWAKAMKDLNLLPPLDRLFAFGFFGENSSTAYTASGAFVGYVKDRFGVEALRAWYGGKSLSDVTGTSFADLERAWHDDLDRVELPEAARAAAKARFDRPALFSRRCPHTIDGCKARGATLQASGDLERAEALYGRVLDLDRGDAGARIAIAVGKLRRGSLDEGKRDLDAIAGDEAVARPARDRALELYADQLLAAGDGDGAIARYKEVASRTIDEDVLRTIDVKTAVARDPRGRRAVVALLIGEGGHGPDRFAAAELLGAWAAATPADGLPKYLLARQYTNAGLFATGAAHLDEALAAQISVPRVAFETERLRAVAACALGDDATAKRLVLLYASHPGVSEARREAARALVERCTASTPAAKPEERR